MVGKGQGSEECQEHRSLHVEVQMFACNAGGHRHRFELNLVGIRWDGSSGLIDVRSGGTLFVL